MVIDIRRSSYRSSIDPRRKPNGTFETSSNPMTRLPTPGCETPSPRQNSAILPPTVSAAKKCQNGFSIPVPNKLMNSNAKLCPETAEVTFSSYDYLQLRGLSTLPQDDIKFLDLKRCLHVPKRLLLNEFIQSYFLHVHPSLPALSEIEFWRSSERVDSGLETRPRISLFVLNSMLFASSQVRQLAVVHSDWTNEASIFHPQ